ncbi:MAG: hypothetical protein IRZ14_07640 [Chloroflexi bacterium]|nr:hypothetical protein [Chloroflexota bacterium]
MAVRPGRRPFATLRRFVRRPPADEALERCELCGAPIAADHRHLLEVGARRLLCACYACSVLFDRRAASGGKYRLVPERRLHLTDFQMTEAQWQSLYIPVRLAFCVDSTPAGRAVAYYPSPLGPTEAALRPDTWARLVARNPVLQGLEPDVEALLLYRAPDHAWYFLVPVDDCYRLVGLLRTHWRGLSGGAAVWGQIDAFFAALQHRATRLPPAPSAARGGDCSELLG